MRKTTIPAKPKSTQGGGSSGSSPSNKFNRNISAFRAVLNGPEGRSARFECAVHAFINPVSPLVGVIGWRMFCFCPINTLGQDFDTLNNVSCATKERQFRLRIRHHQVHLLSLSKIGYSAEGK